MHDSRETAGNSAAYDKHEKPKSLRWNPSARGEIKSRIYAT